LLKDPKYAVRVKIAKRAAEEIKDGMYLNLGIGMPTLVPIFIPKEYRISMQSENGLLGLAGYPEPGKEDPDLVDPAKQTVIISKDASFFASSESFAMIRGGHLDWTLLGTMEVSENGDLANWIIPNKLVKGMGGAMDLAASNSKVMVLTEHCSKGDQPKILKQCRLPLTGKNCVSKIITELAVFDVKEEGGLILTDLAEETDLETVRKLTEADFDVVKNIKRF
jgi:3-oxoacid CoA-transferase B subunit